MTPLLLAVLFSVNEQKPALMYGGIAVADLGTTEYALSHGAVELHPWGQTRDRRIAMKVAQAALFTAGDVALQAKAPKLVRPYRILIGVTAAFVVGWNLSHAR